MNGYIGNDNRERNERRTDMGGTDSYMGIQLPPLWQEGPYDTPYQYDLVSVGVL